MPFEKVTLPEAKKLEKAAHVSSLQCDAANTNYKNSQAVEVMHTINEIDVYQCVTSIYTKIPA